MQHNSIAGRDLLRRLNNNPLVRARRDPHRNLALRPAWEAAPGLVALQGDWSIESDAGDEAVSLVAADLRDFLMRGGVSVQDSAAQSVRLELGHRTSGFSIEARPGRIVLVASNISNLWSAVVHLENAMRETGVPAIAPGVTQVQPAWELQMSAPAWGANLFVPDFDEEYLSDDAFRLMAHHGINGMLIFGDWVLYATGTELPELEHAEAGEYIAKLQAAARRALRYGIRFYYCALGPYLLESHPLFQRLPEIRGARSPWATAGGESQYNLCSSSPVSLNFHAAVLGNLFKQVPELGGLIAIIGGEAFTHCYTRPAEAKMGTTNCPRCSQLTPEEVVSNLLKVVSTAVHQAAPDARVMAWAYSAHKVWSKDYNQLELIDRLAGDITFMSEIDQGQYLQKDGYIKEIWDYSVDLDRPSDRVVAQALRCAQRGLDLVIKTEVAHGVELLHLPYVPCLPRLGRKAQGIRALRPAGLLLRWGFIGVFDSAADRLAYKARWNPNFAPEVDSGAIAGALCGPAGPQVLEAWRHFDRAVGHIPTLTLTDYYTGPMFLGPAHPLPTWDGATPEAFTACCRLDLQGLDPDNETLRAVRDDLVLSSTSQMGDSAPPVDEDAFPGRQSAPHAGPRVWEDEFAAARDRARLGCQVLWEIDVAALPAGAAAEVEEQRCIGEHLYRTFVTTYNTVRFIHLKEDGGDADELQAIARDELENTTAARQIYERAPWLNLNLRLDGAFPDCLGMVDAKLELLADFVAKKQ